MYMFNKLLKLIVNPIYIIMIILVFYQYIRLEKKEKELLGIVRVTYLKHFLLSQFNGLAVGILISIVLRIIPIKIDISCFKYALILSILMFLVNPRYACIAYSGAGACIIGMVLNKDIQALRSIIVIVGLLHLAEGMLIKLDGHKSYLPLYLEKNHELIGGYKLSRFWCVPFYITLRGYNMLFPVASVLGYTDLAISDSVSNTTKESAKMLISYSLVIFTLVAVSYVYDLILIIAIIASPILHELIIIKRRSACKSKKPSITVCNNAVRVLDVIPNTIADELGLAIGDEVITINKTIVKSKDDVKKAVTKDNELEIVYYSNNEKRVIKKIHRNINNKTLGVLILTEDAKMTLDIKPNYSIFYRIINYIIKKT
ncbi:hypothetical protein PV797_17170 [Clostridiaceae bacterium M8S5]|nr:hypothetical protein PV797_17170 [Clostridiaceae bacterium M8S5]